MNICFIGGGNMATALIGGFVRRDFRGGHLAAGVRAADLARWLGTQNVVRAMPNTPALIQSGMTGLYALPAVSKALREQAQGLLAGVGETLWGQDEAMLEAVTPVSGGGP